ncbi:MAG: P-loop NTPase [Ignavibacteriales bacterium]|nr:P-loop NTPase [Ignavibacteriales bacterium]
MANVTEDRVRDALRGVEDPELKKDLVTLNMIKKIDVQGDDVSVLVELTTPACPLKNKIQNDCVAAIKNAVPEAKTIDVEMGAKTVASDKPKDVLPGVKNTIAVASGKGGVGKSTISANLAVALAQEGASVGLVDADIYGPSIPQMLGVSEKPKVIDLGEKVTLVPVEKHGLKIMSIGFLMKEAGPVIWRGPMAAGAIKQFLTDVEWGELDYLVFDLPPGTGDIQLTLCQTIPLTGAVIVTTPQDVSLADARKALQMFQKVNAPIVGVVENMSYFIAPDTGVRYNIFGEGGGSKLAEEMSVPFLGGLPIDPRIRAGGDVGEPMAIGMADAEETRMIRELARNVAGNLSKINLGAKEKQEPRRATIA